jgi:hypothetical protein
VIRVAGPVGSFTAGAFVNSQLLVGFVPTDPAHPLAGGTFTAGAKVASFTVRGVAGLTAAFVNSVVASESFGTVSLKSVGANNGGTKFGLLAHQAIARLNVTSPRLSLSQLTVTPVLPAGFGDFEVSLA